MKKTYSLLLLSSLVFTSCFKTAEEIKREKMIDQQLSQSSKIIADLTNQVGELKGQLSSTSGQLEEINHQTKQSSEAQKQTFTQTVLQLSEQVKILTEENKATKAELVSLREEVKAQKKYIKKVTGTLSKISASPKKKATSKLKQAHRAFEKNQKTKAKKMYQELLHENKINAAQRNHVYFNLGLLDFWDKKYDTALVLFSKIYTKYPRSSFAPRSLLYIARCFKNSNKTAEAKASYQELIKNYPKSNHAKTAKKEMI